MRLSVGLMKIIYIYSMYKVQVNKKSFSVEKDGEQLNIDGQSVEADILEYKEGKFHVLSNNKSYSAEILSFDKEEKSFQIKVNRSIFSVTVQDRFDQLLKQMGIDVGAGKKVNDIKAPMPGMVIQVMVEPGQTIKKGDAIVVLEAMKMENILKSPSDGVIKKVHVLKGDKVEKNQVMVFLD